MAVFRTRRQSAIAAVAAVIAASGSPLSHSGTAIVPPVLCTTTHRYATLRITTHHCCIRPRSRPLSPRRAAGGDYSDEGHAQLHQRPSQKLRQCKGSIRRRMAPPPGPGTDVAARQSLSAPSMRSLLCACRRIRPNVSETGRSLPTVRCCCSRCEGEGKGEGRAATTATDL